MATTRHRGHKLTVAEEEAVLALIKDGVGLEVIAVRFGVHSNTVRRIRRTGVAEQHICSGARHMGSSDGPE